MTILFSKIRIAALMVVAILVSSFTSPASSIAVDNGRTADPAITVQLKYLGTNYEHSVFELAFLSSEETRFTVRIRDENDTVLFTDRLKGVSFIKKYLLNTDDLGKVFLYFEVTNNKTGEKVIYKVDRHIRVVENMVINRLK